MSRSAAITRDFGDGEHIFRLGYGELMELQESLDAGPWFIMSQFAALTTTFLSNPGAVKDMSVKMPREIIRIGLIGGGAKPVDAVKLVRTYVEQRPPDESLGLAMEILRAALSGAPDADEVKKKAATKPSKRATNSRAARSASPRSSEPGPQ